MQNARFGTYSTEANDSIFFEDVLDEIDEIRPLSAAPKTITVSFEEPTYE